MKIQRKAFKLLYRSGDEVRENDKVLVYPMRRAVVEAVLKPRTRAARMYYVDKEGGLLLKFQDGDVQVWANAEDEIELVARSPQRIKEGPKKRRSKEGRKKFRNRNL